MSERAEMLLLDTNVWLDYFVAERPSHQSAFELYSYAKAKGIPLLYPTGCAKDLFYLVCASLKRAVRQEKGELAEEDAAAVAEIAWGMVNHLREEAVAVGADQADMWLACKYRGVHEDFEDNLVIAAAQRSGAAYLVTNDEQLVKHAPVPALGPDDALAALRALG